MTGKRNCYRLAVMGLLAAVTAALPATRSAGAQDNKVSISNGGGVRLIRSNGIPGHPGGPPPHRGHPPPWERQ